MDSRIASESQVPSEHIVAKATLPPSNSLADLAARIKVEHQAVASALKSGALHAIAAGELLIEAKQNPAMKHGQWLPWLMSCDISERMAQRYMRLARNKAAIEANPTCVSDLSMNSALAMLAIPRNTGDGMADQTAGLADLATDTAFDFGEIELHRARRGIFEETAKETLAAYDKLGELAIRFPDVLMAELEEVCDKLECGMAEYKAALADNMGLNEDQVAYFASALDNLRQQGIDKDTAVLSLVPEYRRVAGEPRDAMPSDAVFASKVRDVVVTTLRHFEDLAGAA
jgi:hypothetical protein